MEENKAVGFQQRPERQPRRKRSYKRALIIIVDIILVLLIVGSIGLFIRWYTSQDHSAYGQLTSEKYNKNGLKFSFDYPKVMQSDPTIAAKLPDSPVAFTYYDSNQNLQVILAVSHESISNTLQVLGLKPAQYIKQLETGTGSYITALNYMQDSPNSYKTDFPGCNHMLKTTSGQNVVLCINNSHGHTYARVIGATTTTQYTLELIMVPSVWTSHQKVWQKVEQSFSF